jgi:hypothetical protein
MMMALLLKRRGRVGVGILGIVPDSDIKPRRSPQPLILAHKGPSACAQEMFITVLIDYGVKPAGLWRESDTAHSLPISGILIKYDCQDERRCKLLQLSVGRTVWLGAQFS